MWYLWFIWIRCNLIVLFYWIYTVAFQRYFKIHLEILWHWKYMHGFKWLYSNCIFEYFYLKWKSHKILCWIILLLYLYETASKNEQYIGTLHKIINSLLRVVSVSLLLAKCFIYVGIWFYKIQFAAEYRRIGKLHSLVKILLVEKE